MPPGEQGENSEENGISPRYEEIGDRSETTIGVSGRYPKKQTKGEKKSVPSPPLEIRDLDETVSKEEVVSAHSRARGSRLLLQVPWIRPRVPGLQQPRQEKRLLVMRRHGTLGQEL